MILPENASLGPSSVAIHTRIGRDVFIDASEEDLEEEEPSFFSPRIAEHSLVNLPQSLNCRQWSIIAQSHGNTIQLFCLPLGWNDAGEDDNLGEESMSTVPYYLTAKLLLPDGLVRDVGFYSDDGKSSLSSGDDSGSGKESRQKLGFLFQQEQLELWMIQYDLLLWQAVPFNSKLMDPSQVIEECTHSVRAIPDDSEEEEGMLEDDILWAQCKSNSLLQVQREKEKLTTSFLNCAARTVASPDSSEFETKLYLCGSRGVGGISFTSQGVTSLELLDLEEDEEPEDEDYDEEEE